MYFGVYETKKFFSTSTRTRPEKRNPPHRFASEPHRQRQLAITSLPLACDNDNSPSSTSTRHRQQQFAQQKKGPARSGSFCFFRIAYSDPLPYPRSNIQFSWGNRRPVFDTMSEGDFLVHNGQDLGFFLDGSSFDGGSLGKDVVLESLVL